MSHRPATGAGPRSESRDLPALAVGTALARPLALARGPAREELLALAREQDPALLQDGLMGFAGRQEAAGRLDLAAEVYTALAGEGGGEPALRRRAQQRLDAILGRGAGGARAEFLLRSLAQQASDPAALFAMGAAEAVFRLTRAATLGRLAVSPHASLWTRGRGARVAAALAGFALEAPAFTLAGRAANAALGRPLEWSAAALGRDLASSYLVLGGLKLAGWAGGAAYRGLAGPVGTGGERALRTLLQQGGMFSGILLGHSLEERLGLRPRLDGATTLVDSLAMLLQFHVAGNLTRHAFGPRFAAWERGLDLRAARLAPLASSGGPGAVFGPEFAWAGPARGHRPPGEPLSLQVLAMENHGETGHGVPAPLRLPRLGVRHPQENPRTERLHREEAERQLRALVPRGYLEPADLDRPGFVSRLLACFGVTDHAFDQGAFRRGFAIARAHPERVARIAFDIDEVLLHWAFSPADLFRGGLERGAEAFYRNTEPGLLDYSPFQSAPGVRLNFFERLWFQGIQRLFPGRFRQHIQFHPGVRAFQLGLRLGQDKNLIMATTGPAGRILRLANEDPALKMIYFGRGPAESVTIGEVREGLNIYTREDLVLAMREAAGGEVGFPEHPIVESYRAKIREFPDRGVKLKHPALALLRGKRPFDILVDDSASTFEMLGGLEGFTVLQPPSARPGLTLNFTLGSPERYLDRMANGYVHELGEILASASRPGSTRLSSGATAPEDYPFQRFAIEIPWNKFGAEFVAPNRELKALGQGLARALLPAAPRVEGPAPLSLSEAQLARLTDRVHREFELILDERPGTVSVEAAHTLMYRDLAQSSPEDFQAMLDRHFGPQEQAALPQASRPLGARGAPYFSRVAALMSAKQAVCQLLGLDLARHSREVLVRLGRPVLTGEAARVLGQHQMMTAFANDGEVGLGIALIEPGVWGSGLVGIGAALTTPRVRYTRPARHALALAAYNATYPTHNVRRFTHRRAEDVGTAANGELLLTGPTMEAARELRGDLGLLAPLKVRGLHFQVGEAVVGLVAVPSIRDRRGRGLPMRPFGTGVPEAEMARGASGKPYLRDVDGVFRLPEPGMTVVTLGDVGAVRTIDLARQGHYSIHIERDPEMLEMAGRLFGVAMDDLARERPGEEPPTAEFRMGDWYDTTARADRVEAYYPLHVGDVPRVESPEFHPALREFLNRALLSKLAPGGAGFVISEFRELIQGLEQVVREDPRLQILEAGYDQSRLPLVGGYGVTHQGSNNSYLVFRLRP